MIHNPTTDSLHVGPCRLNHWPELARMIRAEMDMDAGSISYYLRHNVATTGVAYLGRKPVGCYVYYPIKLPGVAWLGIIAVDSAHQGRGIGRRLLRDFERRAAMNGFERVEMSVNPANTGAQRFYEREGYSRIDRTGEVFTYAKPLHPGRLRPSLVQSAIYRPFSKFLANTHYRILYHYFLKRAKIR